jgi:putative endonuclease
LEAAMRREKRIKSWKRAWKIELIETDNPHWIDLYPSLSS